METTASDIGGLRIAVGIAVLVILLVWETAKPFFPFFKGQPAVRGTHVLRNLGMAVLNAALVGLCFAYLWAQGTAWSANAEFGLLHRLALPVWVHACLAILLLDLWTYWWHRANHRIPWLWRFHRVHHSDPWMDVSSGRRRKDNPNLTPSDNPILTPLCLGLLPGQGEGYCAAAQ